MGGEHQDDGAGDKVLPEVAAEVSHKHRSVWSAEMVAHWFVCDRVVR